MHQPRRRFIAALFLTILTLTITASAQPGQGGPPPGGGGPPTAAQELARLQKQLTLTEEESTAILPILEKRHTEIDALMQSSSDRAANGAQIHTIIDTTNKQIRELLTEAQQKIFDSLRPPKPPTGQGSSTNSSDSDHEAPPSNDNGTPPSQN